ncbi:hypothetical protein N9D63_02400 [Opitutales bacterium]|nr:hypothetical protein [Opitutales bacterium]
MKRIQRFTHSEKPPSSSFQVNEGGEVPLQLRRLCATAAMKTSPGKQDSLSHSSAHSQNPTTPNLFPYHILQNHVRRQSTT